MATQFASRLAAPEPIPTALAGVRAAPPLPADFDPRKADQATLLAHGLFFRPPAASDAPAVKAAWDQAFAKPWLAANHIVPVLEPQIGVTHELRGQALAADGSFTSNNWAGGVLQGTWTSTYGAWRIPTVTKPDEPQGSEGGWNSSSWVGLDGAFGSNDVLQAGIQQRLDAGGNASYVAWYEWFAPQKPNSPAYIFQTNIANFPVAPGQTVYCSVQYVNGKGQVTFGNDATGKYFSITLDPPPGASASGNCAEWIVEAPDGGETTSSLPGFTPVHFTSAIACGAKTSGDPAGADTFNCVGFGKTLTAVTLGTYAVAVEFAEYQGKPGGGLVGSNQHGIGNQTDVVYVDTNGALYVAWVDGAGAWQGPARISPTGVAPVGAALAASNQFGIANQTDVFFLDNAGALNVAWVDGAGAWQGPARISPTGVAPVGGALAASNQFGIPNQTDVFFVDNAGALNVAWVVGGGRWGGPGRIGGTGVAPPGAGVAACNQFGIPNQTDVFFVDNAGALNVAWVVGGGRWGGPGRIGGTGVAPPGAGVAACNQFGIPNQTDVFFVDNAGALNVAWVDGGGAWNGPVRISPTGIARPGAPVAACNQFGIPNQTDVFFVDTAGALNVAWVVGGGKWGGPGRIGAVGVAPSGAAVAASNQFGIGNQTDVFLIDRTGALNVAWVNAAGAWHGPVAIGD